MMVALFQRAPPVFIFGFSLPFMKTDERLARRAARARLNTNESPTTSIRLRRFCRYLAFAPILAVA
jgi:hypothetical protein